MRRRYGSGRLTAGAGEREDLNPMEGVANLADVMLVLACGLMLALIINWNVDVAGAGAPVEVDQGQEITELEGLQISGETSLDEDAQYEEMGTVYRDPATGKMYMVVEDSGEGG